jgi:membrane fusion protein (multidrug efflux system)
MKSIVQNVVLASISAVFFYSCSGSDTNDAEDGPPPAIPVSVYEVQQQNATFYDQYPGTITALKEVEIRPQVAGYITGIHFKDGQHVRKGQKLYSIDQQQYAANYQQSKANLDVAKANLARAQQDADRYTELAKQDAIAKQTLDHALAELQAAKSQVAAAQANVGGVQTSLRYSTIYAPFDGTIGISQVKVGAAVAPGQMVLNTVSSDNPLAVDFAVQEKDIGRFTQLRQQSKASDSTFTILLPDGTVYPHPGTIDLIDRAVDPQTGTIRTRLVFKNNKDVLKPGMSCTVRVLNRAFNTVLIPYKSVTEQLGEYFVYVVGDSSKVSQRKIATGTQIGTNVIVREGLNASEKIVVQGVQNLREGSAVKVDSTVTM